MSVSVLTASLPERHELLVENLASIRAQTLKPAAHLVCVGSVGDGGPPAIYNQLAKAAKTEWISYLDDDDVADPDHLETMWAAHEDADVIYTGCRSVGPHNFTGYNVPFNGEQLRYESIVPITCLVRAEVFWSVDGFREEKYADWRLWQRLYEAGARFRQIPKITWAYRVKLTPDHRHRSYGDFEELAHA